MSASWFKSPRTGCLVWGSAAAFLLIVGLLAVVAVWEWCQADAQRLAAAGETRTFTPIPTSTSLPVTTATVVPLLTEISCEPASNPFRSVDDFYYAVALFPNIPIARVCTFSGQISRGQFYRHQITEDFVFCLTPTDNGWSIVISDSRPGSCDFNSEDYVNFGPIVTPPFRGNLYFDVDGWHFRNKENTWENDGGVNAPQRERFFNFVFNREGYETVWHAERCNEWKIDVDCASATQSSNKSSEVPRSRAKFTITELELGNLIPNSFAWIEYMEFKVEVYLPAE